MLSLDDGRAGERRDGPRCPRDPRTAPAGQRETLDGAVEQLGRGGRSPRRSACERPACGDDARAHGLGWLARWRCELGRAGSRHLDDEVEAVEQRPRQAFAVGAHPLSTAGAAEPRVAPSTARAEIHRPDQLEPRRIRHAATNACNGYEAVLERLSERFERAACELGELVEQQDTTVRETGLPGSRARPATDERAGG